MPKVYLSYRRTDTVSDSLVSRIAASCEACGVEILAVRNSPAEIEEAIGSADAVWVLIGEKWQALLDEHRGVSGDPVQQEIGFSLEAHKRIMPLLLGGKIPAVDALPERLRAFYLCLGTPVEPDAWEAQLSQVLRPLLAAPAEGREVEANARLEDPRLAQEEAKKQEDHLRAQEILDRAKYFSPGPIFAPGTLPFRAQAEKAQPALTVPSPAPTVPSPAPTVPQPAAVPASGPNPPVSPPLAVTAPVPVPSVPVIAPVAAQAQGVDVLPAPPKPVLPSPLPPPTLAPVAVAAAHPQPETPAPEKKGRGCLGLVLTLLMIVTAGGFIACFGRF